MPAAHVLHPTLLTFKYRGTPDNQINKASGLAITANAG